ncbi:MAG: EpsD family peptidyl-prolyl cis-trans isomerase [Burkholderiales bacterium]
MRLLLCWAVLVAIAVALSACGRTDAQNASGQIAAIVNGEEISVHRVNGALARGNDVQPGEAGQAQALQRVIDQELLVQHALKAKLDRDPQVMQAIEDARRQMLARAYIDRVLGAAAPARSQDEIRTFYQENPALFERRRIYHLHELVVAAPQEKLGALQAAAAAAKSMDEVAGWLKSRELPFTVVTASKPAEQIPLEILPRVLEMRDGQIAVFSTSRGTSVVQVLRSEEAPLSGQQATPVIERYLLNRERLELARAEVGKLRKQAEIEYLGEFKPAAPEGPAAASAAPGGVGDAHIEKGVAGLR